MIIIDDDGVGHNVVPVKVIEDIKQEIPKLGLGIIGQNLVLECIDKHTKGTEQC